MNDNSAKDNQARRERRLRSTRIGRHLRQIYDDVVQEDVPDEFLELLEQADKKRSSPGES